MNVNDMEQNSLFACIKGIAVYATENGKEPFRGWLDSLKDVDTQAPIFQRLQRFKLGNFGDCKPIIEVLLGISYHHTADIRIY